MKIKITLVVMLLFVLFACYVTFGERSLLIANNQMLNFNGTQNLKIVQFTDTHIGKYFSVEQLTKAVDKINAQQPDIVIFCGDLFDNARENTNTTQVSAVLEKINAPLGKYAIYGNRDYGGSAVKIYSRLMTEAGFTVLANESSQISINNKTISIFGADDYIFGNNNVKALMSNIDKGNFNILLSHEPDALLRYADYPINLALSGHSHGGQVRIPFYGALIETNFCDYFSKGLYTMDNLYNTKVFVSSGLGNTKVPFRLGNIPEIVVFNLAV